MKFFNLQEPIWLLSKWYLSGKINCTAHCRGKYFRPTYFFKETLQYKFDFDQSKLSGLHSDIPIYENSTDIKPIYVTYEKYYNMVPLI